MIDDNGDPPHKSLRARYQYKYLYKYGSKFAADDASSADTEKHFPSENSENRNDNNHGDTDSGERRKNHDRAEGDERIEEQQGAENHDDKAEREKNPDREDDNNPKRRWLLIGLGALFIVAAIVWLLLWFFVFSMREKTDDAYVGGNQVMVSAKVSGTVIEIGADETQRVEAGQVLVRLDPVDATAALKRAQSNLAQAVRQVRQQYASAEQADAQVARQRIELQRAAADLKRREPLLQDEAVAPEEVIHAREQYQVMEAAVRETEQQAASAHALIDGGDIETNPAVQQAIAAFRDAWVASARNAIVAPVNGYVAQRQVQIGQTIQPGQNLFTIVPLENLWIDANLKEGQLQHVRIGQPAEVEPDIYHGDVIFHGRVVGLAPGTGGAFALLPPQNASGNWIKVVQRLPVRIALDNEELRKYPLRIGLSTKTIIDTHERGGAVLTARPVQQPVAQTRVYDRELEQAESAAQKIVRDNLSSSLPSSTKKRTSHESRAE